MPSNWSYSQFSRLTKDLMHTKGIPLMQAFPYKILILCFFSLTLRVNVRKAQYLVVQIFVLNFLLLPLFDPKVFKTYKNTKQLMCSTLSRVSCPADFVYNCTNTPKTTNLYDAASDYSEQTLPEELSARITCLRFIKVPRKQI